MFTQFKERMTEKLKNIGPQDELDKTITALVDRGTSGEMVDWDANMQLVDIVNRHPELACEKVLRITNRTIAKPVVRVQVLALTMLDTCVRNCHPLLHHHLAQSLLWGDLIRLVQDNSVSQIDGEVRDRILCMVEDYGRWIKQPPSFAETYESLVDQGIDFPVRSPEDQTPFEPYQPPVPVMADGQPGAVPVSMPPPVGPPAAQQQRPGSGTASTAASLFTNLFAGLTTSSPPHGQQQQQQHQQYPPPQLQQQQQVRMPESAFEGMSEEDRLAVTAAMADLELQAGTGVGAEGGVAVGVPASAATPPRPPPGPPLPADPQEALQIITNSVTLFSEMVAGVPDSDPLAVRDQFITELAEQCTRYRSRLVEMLGGELADETQVVAALAQNDALTGAMARYDELLARALASPLPNLPEVHDTAARAAAATNAIVTGASARPAAASNFTLLDEDEEEEDSGLATKRQAGSTAAAAGQPAAGAAAATGAGGDDSLLDLLGAPAQQQPAAKEEAAPLMMHQQPAPVPSTNTSSGGAANEQLAGLLDVLTDQPAASQHQQQQQQSQGGSLI